MEPSDITPGWIKRLKTLVFGVRLSPFSPSIHQSMALAAFLAWVGLGADGVSSSCYGPSETFLALLGHPHLAIFVALAVSFTIFVIGMNYSQVVELFPTGGGGYLVASKLLNPTFGMISGCALLVDYVLTITLSIASGTDALFSWLPAVFQPYRLEFAVLGVVVLTLMNLRGVKESVLTLVPIFVIFILTHVFLITYALISHASNFHGIVADTTADFHRTTSQLGMVGTLFLMLRAYSLGAGTYTGLEAVSNGIPVLREPKVHTARITMVYMIISLAMLVSGLLLAYLLYHVEAQQGKTLNAILLAKVTAAWKTPGYGITFLIVTLASETAILFVAAQTGFIDGPRILANMALDRWLPTRLAILSDRLVTQNGVLIMGVASLILMILANGAVDLLVVLYSINVFITFVLTQMGMVRHWLTERALGRSHNGKLAIASSALVLCTFILISVTLVKFKEGGWITLLITGTLVVCVTLIRRHYTHTGQLLRRLDERVLSTLAKSSDMRPSLTPKPEPQHDPTHKTAVILVNGFNGLGLHTLFNVNRLFGGLFRNFVFLEVGVIDAGNFKGTAEIDHLRQHSQSQAQQYVELVKRNGYYAETFTSVTTDVVEEITTVAQKILDKYPGAVFFGGQLVFPKELVFGRWLHNNIIFAVQRRFYFQGIPIVILPIRVF